MRKVALAAAMLFLAISAAGSASASQARLRIVSVTPFTVRGEQFRPGEAVLLTLTERRRWVRHVQASATGAFVASFGRITLDLCTGYTVHAVGNRGTRASLHSPRVRCPPRPRTG